MKHFYLVTGMVCGGCRSKVEEKLKSVPGVIAVEVNPENDMVEIEMESHIPLAVFQNILPEKYSISEAEPGPVYDSGFSESNKKSWKQLFPLFLILGYITAASFLLNRNPADADGFMLDFMGLFYIVFSFFKMLDLKGFPDSFRMYDPLAKKIPLYALAYPFIETALGLMFLLRFEISIALAGTIVILGTTTTGVAKTLLDKRSIQCACLGTALKLPMTKATLIENTIMIVMATAMLLRII